jgi:hypothetical protein
MIRIRSHQEGFRRAGVAHSKEWKEYADDHFTAEQLEQLVNEPMLQVEEVDGEPESDKGDTESGDAPLPKFADITVDQIKERLDKLGVAYPDAKVKADFYGLLEAAKKKGKE